mgnify:CR=1 FL=1
MLTPIDDLVLDLDLSFSCLCVDWLVVAIDRFSFVLRLIRINEYLRKCMKGSLTVEKICSLVGLAVYCGLG